MPNPVVIRRLGLSSLAAMLLPNLTAYWKMGEPTGATRMDSTPNNLHLTDTNTNLPEVAGKIVGAAEGTQTNSSNSLVHAANPLFVAGAGVSFSFAGWWRGNGLILDHHMLSNWNASGSPTNSYVFFYSSSNSHLFWAALENGTLTGRFLDIVSGASFGTVVFHHIAMGYDTNLQQLWAHYDNGPRLTLGCADVNGTSAPFTLFNLGGGTTPQQIDCCELGFWRRSLSPADVNALWNGGMGITYPFS